MAASERQILSNRQNALRSTGPRTEEGKAVSRANSYKHGLTAEVVVPADDRAEVAARVDAVQRSGAPEGDAISLILAQQVAFLSIRQERCFHHIEAVTAERVRNAEADHDDVRRSAAEHMLDAIGAEPMTYRRRLLATPEGTDLLIETLEALRRDVGTPDHMRWTDYHGSKLEQYLGKPVGSVPVPRGAALSDLITRNDASKLDPAEVAPLGADYRTRVAWALPELARVIDEELGRLREHRTRLDPARADASRATAAQRATGGADRELVRLQNYEASTCRALRAAVRELHDHRREARLDTPARRIEANQAAVEARPDPISPSSPPPPLADLASFPRNVLAGRRPIDASRIVVGKPPHPPLDHPPTAPNPPRYTP